MRGQVPGTAGWRGGGLPHPAGLVWPRVLGGLSRAREARLEELGRGGGRWPLATLSGHPGVGVAGPGQLQRGLSGPLLVFTGAWKRAGLPRGRERGKLKSKNKNKVPPRRPSRAGGDARRGHHGSGAVATATWRRPVAAVSQRGRCPGGHRRGGQPRPPAAPA